MQGSFGRPPQGLGRASLPTPWAVAGRSQRQTPPAPGEDSPGRQKDPSARVARVEAAMWLAMEPLTLKKIARIAGLEGVGEARELVAQLRKRLASRRSAIEVTEVAGGLRLTTRPCFAPWLQKLTGTTEDQPGGVRITPAAGETLTIVAYRQPVVRAEVEAIRGVGCGEVLRQLLEADLLRIVGRSEELGRPLLYGTTRRFLELYGLGNLDDLPGRNEGADGAGPTKHNAAADNAA